MSREDIIRMAREAGVSPVSNDQIKFAGPMWLCLERFANLVVAEEREACAKVCEEIAKEFPFEPHEPDPVLPAYCAEAIRARGDK